MPSRAAADGAAEVGLRPSQIVGANTSQEGFTTAGDEMERDEDVPSSALASSQSSLADLKPYLGIAGVRTIASLNVSNFSQADWDDLLLAGEPGGELGNDLELVDDELLGKKAGERPGASDDSWDEGEDEDSNDEGFYRNDYPEQEISDDDEFGLGHEYRDDSGEDDDDWY